MADPASAADSAAPAETSGRLVIRNIGLVLSGDLARPILDADAIFVENGRIAAYSRKAREPRAMSRGTFFSL